MNSGEEKKSFNKNKQVEQLIRKRWKTYNLQWMGQEKFDDLVKKKVQSDHYQQRHLSFLESNIPDLNDRDVLDVGSGEGGFVVALKKRGMRVLGVDLSKMALDIAHLQLSCREGIENPSILAQAEGHQLPFANNSFDLITSIDTLEHIPDLPGFLQEIQRILKKGGYFYANTPNRHWPYETHCRMYLLHWLPREFRPFLIKTFFPKRIKKLEKLDYLDAINLQTPEEVKRLSKKYFETINEISSVLLNRYKNDEKNNVEKGSRLKSMIIWMALRMMELPVLSFFIKVAMNRYSPEIILISRK